MVSEEFFYPISSEKKAEGAKKFLAYLPRFLQRDLPSKQAVPLMHRIATVGELPVWPESLVEILLTELATRENPDLAQEKDKKDATNNLKTYLRHVFRKTPDKWRQPKVIKFSSSGKGGKASSVEIRPTALRRGHFRSVGGRTREGGASETIFTSHLTPIFTDASEKEIESVYIGPVYKLDEQFNSLCDRCDKLTREAKTLDEHLKVIVFMQLMGASVLHPFFDGNGRAFNAKLIYDLNKLGFPVKEMPTLPEFDEKLAVNPFEDTSRLFLSEFLVQHALGLVRPNMVNVVVNTPHIYKGYMQGLHDAIAAQIQEGPPKDETLDLLLQNGVNIVKVYLSREAGRAEKRGESFGPPTGDPLHVDRALYSQEVQILDLSDKTHPQG
jgi:hypothetical protein